MIPQLNTHIQLILDGPDWAKFKRFGHVWFSNYFRLGNLYSRDRDERSREAQRSERRETSESSRTPPPGMAQPKASRKLEPSEREIERVKKQKSRRPRAVRREAGRTQMIRPSPELRKASAVKVLSEDRKPETRAVTPGEPGVTPRNQDRHEAHVGGASLMGPRSGRGVTQAGSSSSAPWMPSLREYRDGVGSGAGQVRRSGEGSFEHDDRSCSRSFSGLVFLLLLL